MMGFTSSFSKFEDTFKCYSATLKSSFSERPELIYGGKIVLPQSALNKLTALNITYPMLFKISNVKLEQQNKKRQRQDTDVIKIDIDEGSNASTKSSNEPLHSYTHAGVLEFTAEEGRVYLPDWMMKSLNLSDGGIVQIQNVDLPLGRFVKIQPQSVDFLDITNPKAVLERAFRDFSTLTQGDIITFKYNDHLYDIFVMETKPAKGISIIETDLEVDFAAPVGYVEPGNENMGNSGSIIKKGNAEKIIKGTKSNIEHHTIKDEIKFQIFQGSGYKLNGKDTDKDKDGEVMNAPEEIPAILRLPRGKLFFGYPVIPIEGNENNVDKKGKSFEGNGISLKQARKNEKK